MAACTRAPLRVSVGKRNVVSNPATPNADMSRRMRATALSIPRPAGDESSGMKGELTDSTPYTVPCRASRTERQNARLSRAGPEARHEAGQQRLNIARAHDLRPNGGDQVPGHRPHVLLERRQGGDVAAAHGVSREAEAEPAASRIGELVVPRHDAGIERHPQD